MHSINSINPLDRSWETEPINHKGRMMRFLAWARKQQQRSLPGKEGRLILYASIIAMRDRIPGSYLKYVPIEDHVYSQLVLYDRNGRHVMVLFSIRDFKSKEVNNVLKGISY